MECNVIDEISADEKKYEESYDEYEEEQPTSKLNLSVLRSFIDVINIIGS